MRRLRVDGELDEIEELKELPIKSAKVILEISESLEPKREDVDLLAASVRIRDTGAFCRHSYILSVLCIRIERWLNGSAVSGSLSR